MSTVSEVTGMLASYASRGEQIVAQSINSKVASVVQQGPAVAEQKVKSFIKSDTNQTLTPPANTVKAEGGINMFV